jgi:hypothetical protein
MSNDVPNDPSSADDNRHGISEHGGSGNGVISKIVNELLCVRHLWEK